MEALFSIDARPDAAVQRLQPAFGFGIATVRLDVATLEACEAGCWLAAMFVVLFSDGLRIV